MSSFLLAFRSCGYFVRLSLFFLFDPGESFGHGSKDFYGAEIGKGFIEIHHTKPIFKYLDEDIENTLEHAVKNLAPVCSNCHRMIHRNWSKPLEIQDLISNVNQYGVFKRFA